MASNRQNVVHAISPNAGVICFIFKVTNSYPAQPPLRYAGVINKQGRKDYQSCQLESLLSRHKP